MKTWEKLIEVIDKLDKEDERLELAIDDAWVNYSSSKNEYEKKQLSNYLDKLREQRREVFLCTRLHTKSLSLRNEENNVIAFFHEDGLVFNSKFMDNTETEALHKWLVPLMEEINPLVFH